MSRRDDEAQIHYEHMRPKRRKSQPLKGPYGALPTVPPPAPRSRRARKTVPLYTPTGRPRQRMNTQQREQRNAARARSKAERAAKSEHERRSEAARKGWAKIPKEERTRRAERGWETRDMRYPRNRNKARVREDRRRNENLRHPSYAERFPRPHYDF